jgi:hypothetical protein
MKKSRSSKHIRKIGAVLTAAALLFVSCGPGAAPEETSAGEREQESETTSPEEISAAGTAVQAPSGAAILTDYAGASNGGADWAPAVEEAFRHSDTVFIPEGEYLMSEVKLSSGQTLRGAGSGTVIIQKDDAERLFNISGSRKKVSDLIADKVDFSDSFLLKKSAGLKPGDRIFLLGQRNAMILEDDGREWCLGRSYAGGTACFYSEFLTVASVSEEQGGTLVRTTSGTVFPFYYADGRRESDPLKPTSQSATGWPYRRAATTCWKMDMAKHVTVADMTVKNAHGYCIYALWAEGLSVSGLTVMSPEDRAPKEHSPFVRMLECLDSAVTGCVFSVPVKPDTASVKAAGMGMFGSYNMLWILSSSGCGFEGCSVDFGTHCVAFGKKHGEGVNTGCFVKNCSLSGAVWSGIFVAQGSYDTELSGNTVSGCPLGIMTAGRKTLISGNSVTGPGTAEEDYDYMKREEGGTAGIVLTEGYSFDAVVTGNVVEGVDTGLLIRDGYEKTNVFDGIDVEFRDNRMAVLKNGTFVWKNRFNTSAKSMVVPSEGNEIVKTG